MLLELPDRLKTGIPTIDEQHAALVDLHNEIVRGYGQDRPAFFAIEALARLYQYSRQHFTAEEQLMARYGFEGLEAHRDEHGILLVELRNTVLRYRDDPARVDDSIQGYVRDWVLEHIESCDLEFAAPVREAMERERTELVAG